MRFFNFLLGRRETSAAVAKERLQIVLTHERAERSGPDFLPTLEQELLDLLGRYIDIRNDSVHVNLDKTGETSLLEINIEIDSTRIKAARPPGITTATSFTPG
jgi:cell division topological specificity factor